MLCTSLRIPQNSLFAVKNNKQFNENEVDYTLLYSNCKERVVKMVNYVTLQNAQLFILTVCQSEYDNFGITTPRYNNAQLFIMTICQSQYDNYGLTTPRCMYITRP